MTNNKVIADKQKETKPKTKDKPAAPTKKKIPPLEDSLGRVAPSQEQG